MIIEIALGIVLAVLILMNLDWILGLGLILIVVAIGLVTIGVVIYFAAKYPTEVAFAVGAVALVAGAAYLESRTGNFKRPAPLDSAGAISGVAGESNTTAKFSWGGLSRGSRIAIAVYLLSIVVSALTYMGLKLVQ